MSDVTLWRYYLPNDRPLEGWAEIVIGSNGFFAAVSDWGNYAFRWSEMGVADAREFFLTAERYWEYFAKKLGGENAWEFDGQHTLRNVKSYILSMRRSREMSVEEARREWDRFELLDLTAEEEFREWMDDTRIECPYEFAARRIRTDLEAFCKRVLPRLALRIQVDLAAGFREKAHVWFRGICRDCRVRFSECDCCIF